MEQVVHDTLEMPWEPLQRFPGTGEEKELRHEPKLGALTMLVRLPAGGRVAPHSHMGVVQHYVLEGAYEHEGRTYGTGAYRLLPAHGDVEPITTRSGVTFLIIYDPLPGA